MKYYRRYCGDYLRDTQHLTAIEHGFYTLLLDYYYATEEPFPDDMKRLTRLCRASNLSQKRILAKVLNEFFPVNGDGLRHNKRADEEILKYHDGKVKMRAGGLKGALARLGRVGLGVPSSPPLRVEVHPPSSSTKAFEVESPTRAGQNPEPFKKILDSTPEKNKRIGELLRDGKEDEARKLRDG